MKKNFSLKFMAMAMVAALTVAPGCKDYDDDINNLREQTAGIKSELAKAKTDLTAAIKDVEAKAAAAQKAADDAKAAADKALKDALAADAKLKAELEALADKAQKAAEAAQKTADEANKKADQLRKELDALVKRVDALERNSATKQELEKAKTDLKAEIDKVMKRVEEFVGNRVTSIALVPRNHVNGIASVELLGVAYKAQEHVVDHQPFYFTTTDVANATKVLKPSQGVAEFRLSPSRVTEASFTHPSFNTWVSKNRLRVDEDETGVDKPFKPMAYRLQGNHLIVDVVKTSSESLNQGEHWKNEFISDPWCENPTTESKVEKFYMGALSLPIAEKYWTAEEKAAAEKPAVISEGFRVEEIYVAPVIKSKIASGREVGYITIANPGPGAVPQLNQGSHHAECFADYKPYAYDDVESPTHYWDANGNGKKDNGELSWGRPTHFSDSTLLYSSGENQFIDLNLEWNKTYDLMDYVTASTRASHDEFDYKKHGLGFYFAVAKGEYLQGAVNKTNQQEFAKLEGSVLSNKVFSVPGNSQTAVGREPIIRITLYDLKTKAIVDQRYMKVKWVKTAEVIDLGTSEFKPFLISCKDQTLRLDTEKMNVDIYTKAEKAGVPKTMFTDRYTRLEILELKKLGGEKPEPIVSNGAFVDPYLADGATMTPVHQTGAYAAPYDLELYFVPEDQEESTVGTMPPGINAGNTSFNIIWKLGVDVMRQIAEAGSTFELKFKFLDRLNEKHFTHTFRVKATLPVQEFNYEQTYWSDGKMGTEFKVNPIVYTPQHIDGTMVRKVAQLDYDNVDYNDGYFVHTYSDVAVGDSHIQADLMNGFIYNGKKPKNLGQFIQYIRSCATVQFEFDADEFHRFDYLVKAGKEYVVSDDGTQLWRKAVGNVVNKNFVQSDKDDFAASILNFLSVTALSNKDNKTTRPWDFDEAISNNNTHGAVDEARALVRLHELEDNVEDETASDSATGAAKEIVGKVVPVKLVVAYNKWNVVTVKKFDVRIINPLKVSAKNLGSLQDATVSGSYTEDLTTKFTYTDWNNYKVAQKKLGSSEKEKYSDKLWKYYAVKVYDFDVKNAKTNIKNVDGNNVVTEGYKDGRLPAGNILQQVRITNHASTPWEFEPVANSPERLRYYNNKGTPVNIDYKIYINVTTSYKWGDLITEHEIDVKKAEGTPTP